MVLTAVSGCAETVTRFESYCSLTDYIGLSDAAIDNLTIEDMNQIEIHNETWKEHCL